MGKATLLYKYGSDLNSPDWPPVICMWCNFVSVDVKKAFFDAS